MLQLLREETIQEESLDRYFDGLYRLVCVSERPLPRGQQGALVRTTYVVDWEQLVHLLEDYDTFGEDIVEVSRVSSDEARFLQSIPKGMAPAHA